MHLKLEKCLLHKVLKEERHSRVPRLSDTRYSAKGTKGKWRYASSKARLIYPRSQYMVMCAVDWFKRYGVRVGVANFYQSIGIDETNTFQ